MQRHSRDGILRIATLLVLVALGIPAACSENHRPQHSGGGGGGGAGGGGGGGGGWVGGDGSTMLDGSSTWRDGSQISVDGSGFHVDGVGMCPGQVCTGDGNPIRPPDPDLDAGEDDDGGR